MSIIRAKLPNVNEHLAVQVARAVHGLRASDAILKKPSIAETLDWVSALEALGMRDLTPEGARQTIGFVLKSSEDMEAAGPLLSGGGEEGCSCGHGHGHEHGHCGRCHSGDGT